LSKKLDGILEPLVAGIKKRHEDVAGNSAIYTIGRSRWNPEVEYCGHKMYVNTLAAK
jgi:hypothetical protein